MLRRSGPSKWSMHILNVLQVYKLIVEIPDRIAVWIDLCSRVPITHELEHIV